MTKCLPGCLCGRHRKAASFYPHNHVFYPHYYSTYCVHEKHVECRRTCKTCDEPCLCACHQIEGTEP